MTERDQFSPAFRVKRFVLAQLLRKASSVVPDGTVLPVLRNFLVDVFAGDEADAPSDGPLLRIIASDFELSVVASTPLVEVLRPGRCVLPAQRLLAMIAEADETDVDLDVDGADRVAEVAVRETRWRLMLEDADEYPPLDALVLDTSHQVSREDFRGALAAVRYAVGRGDSNRTNLMMVHIADGRVIASDNVRYHEVAVDGLPDMDVPANAVGELLKVLAASEAETVGFAQDDQALVFRVGDDQFVAQRPTIDFPDMDAQMLTAALGNDVALDVDRHELLSAIRRVRIVADETTSAVLLDVEPSHVTVTASDRMGSRATEEVECAWGGKTTQAAFNHAHLTELLGAFGSDRVALLFAAKRTATRPGPVLVREDAALATLGQLRVDFLAQTRES